MMGSGLRWMTLAVLCGVSLARDPVGRYSHCAIRLDDSLCIFGGAPLLSRRGALVLRPHPMSVTSRLNVRGRPRLWL